MGVGNGQCPRPKVKSDGVSISAWSLSRQALSNELHCALETRYNRYIVINQPLNLLQIGYRPVTPVTSLSISNLAGACHQPPAPTFRCRRSTTNLHPCIARWKIGNIGNIVINKQLSQQQGGNLS
jgi:hypothetical protein